MYSVKFSSESEIDLQKFIGYMKNYFLHLYSDTGIIDEYKIVAFHNESLEALYFDIKGNIQNMAEEGLLGFKPKGDCKDYIMCENVYKIRSYRITFESRKYESEKVITIENIKISKGK